MKIYGLIGFPLGHSWSPEYFNNKFKEEGIAAEYQLFSFQNIQGFPTLICEVPNLAGLNVTIPHKQAIIPYLDELSAAAKAIGAVNTIAFKEGKLIGHNTDTFGFSQSLDTLKILPGTRALVLGTGGSSKAVGYVLSQRNIPFKSVSRSQKGDITYEQLTSAHFSNHKLIVNCTPIGMYPNVAASPPIPFSGLTNQHVVIDLIYNPEETALLRMAKLQGAKTMNGLFMLQQQAEKAWKIWQA